MTIQVDGRQFADVDALEKLVIHAATEYEINGFVEDFDGVEVSDPEYDALYRKLEELKPNSVAFKGTSPSAAQASGDTITHDPPMTSISKADGELEEKDKILNDWLKSCADSLGISVNDLQIAQSFKHDGVAVRVNYVKGKLKSAGLRPRDGVNGTDVTHHIANVKGVPKKLPLPLTLSLNGEIECHMDDFKEINVARDAAGEDLYKNPRNYTAGCMGRDDAKETKDAKLRITFYSITGFDEWRDYYGTEVERAMWANSDEGLALNETVGKKTMGFFVQMRVYEYRHLALMEQHAPKLPYYVDGVVLKVNDLEQQEQLGHSGDDLVNPPRGAIAWKFEEETAEAVVTGIEWNASRTGRVVPTALFDEPFVLADTENTRATCNNYGWMEDRGLGIGAKVRVKKGGKIIPNIMAVLDAVDDVGAPDTCPTCSAKLAIETSSSGNRDLKCNNADCGAKQVKSWLYFIQKLGGKGLGLSAMEKVLATGKVKRIVDLYHLTEDDLTENERFSERQATLAVSTIWFVKFNKDNDKLQAAVEKARGAKIEVDAYKFFAAMGIPGAGETAGKALVAHYGDFDAIREARYDDLVAIDGIGDTTAQAITDWFDAHDGDVDSLLDFFELKLPKKGKLSGKNFVLTGKFTEGKKHWQALIEEEGGNIQSSVGSSTNYLVQEHGKTDGTPSAKEKAAEKYGTEVISVPELEGLLNA